jgi:hypothetical protein
MGPTHTDLAHYPTSEPGDPLQAHRSTVIEIRSSEFLKNPQNRRPQLLRLREHRKQVDACEPQHQITPLLFHHALQSAGQFECGTWRSLEIRNFTLSMPMDASDKSKVDDRRKSSPFHLCLHTTKQKSR